MTSATSIFLIGLAFIMLGFVLSGLILKQKILLWFGAFLALIWGILMSTNTTFLTPVDYIWNVLGVSMFIVCVILTMTLNKTKKEIIEESEPEDIREARNENDNVRKQFDSMRMTNHGTHIHVKRNKYTGLKNG